MGFVETIRREANTLLTLQRVKKWTGDIAPDSENLVADDFESVVDKFPNNVAWRFEGNLTTYAEMDALANKFANWGLSLGLQAGDAVALFMENRPEYVSAWYGLSKIGVVVGLINHNLTDKALAHCVNIADAKLIVTGADQDEAIRSGSGLFEGHQKVAKDWSFTHKRQVVQGLRKVRSISGHSSHGLGVLCGLCEERWHDK